LYNFQVERSSNDSLLALLLDGLALCALSGSLGVLLSGGTTASTGLLTLSSGGALLGTLARLSLRLDGFLRSSGSLALGLGTGLLGTSLRLGLSGSDLLLTSLLGGSLLIGSFLFLQFTDGTLLGFFAQFEGVLDLHQVSFLKQSLKLQSGGSLVDIVEGGFHVLPDGGETGTGSVLQGEESLGDHLSIRRMLLLGNLGTLLTLGAGGGGDHFGILFRKYKYRKGVFLSGSCEEGLLLFL